MMDNKLTTEKMVLTALENEIQLTITSSFSLNFDPTTENVKKEGLCVVKHRITQGKNKSK